MLSNNQYKTFILVNAFYSFACLFFFYALSPQPSWEILPLTISFFTLFLTFSFLTLIANSFTSYRFGLLGTFFVGIFYLIPVFQAFYFLTYGRGFDLQLLSVLIREPRFVLNTALAELTFLRAITLSVALGLIFLTNYFFFFRKQESIAGSPYFYFHKKWVLLLLFILVGTQIKWCLDHDASQLTIRPLYPVIVFFLLSLIHHTLLSSSTLWQKTFTISIPIGFFTIMYAVNTGAHELKSKLNVGSAAYTSLFGAYFVQGTLGDMKQNSGLEIKIPNTFAKFNVLLIVNDSQRWDILGVNGFSQNTTERIDWFLKRSYNFQFPIAPANFTDTSLPGVFYGLGSDKDVLQIKESLTIWDYFSRNSATFFYSDADYSWSKLNLMIESVGQQDAWSLLLSDEKAGLLNTQYASYGADKVITKIASIKNKPWFGVWHSESSHHPYAVPKDEEVNKPCDLSRESGIQSFKNCYINANFHTFKNYDKVLRSIDLENTVVIMTSDHGEGMNEHNLMFHGEGYYQEIVKVPLIIYIPDSIKEKVPSENLRNLAENTGKVTSGMDIAPTLLRLHEILTGEKIADLERLSGSSLLDPMPENRIVFSSHCYPQYRCYSREILLANEDFYGIFDPAKGFVAIYDTWKDLEQKNPLSPEKLLREDRQRFIKYLKAASQSHPLAQSIPVLYQIK